MLNINKLINTDVVEKYTGVKVAEGGFSLHDNNAVVGMNIYDKNGNTRDDFFTVQYYLECLKKEFKES